jgi:hypothetical protein
VGSRVIGQLAEEICVEDCLDPMRPMIPISRTSLNFTAVDEHQQSELWRVRGGVSVPGLVPLAFKLALRQPLYQLFPEIWSIIVNDTVYGSTYT